MMTKTVDVYEDFNIDLWYLFQYILKYVIIDRAVIKLNRITVFVLFIDD